MPGPTKTPPRSPLLRCRHSANALRIGRSRAGIPRKGTPGANRPKTRPGSHRDSGRFFALPAEPLSRQRVATQPPRVDTHPSAIAERCPPISTPLVANLVANLVETPIAGSPSWLDLARCLDPLDKVRDKGCGGGADRFRRYGGLEWAGESTKFAARVAAGCPKRGGARKRRTGPRNRKPGR